MKSLDHFFSKVDFVLTDIDDTLTDEGRLGPEAYSALWDLNNAGIQVIPVTGRPAGWCEMIARVWPVAAVVGENGGFYFRYNQKKMHRCFFFDEETQKQNQMRLQDIRHEILKKIPGTAVASDQFTRLMDLAIDFCEDVPALPKSEVQKIVNIFHAHGAEAKVSSIHVNGWFGKYDKLSQSLNLLKQEFSIDAQQAQTRVLFAGDSPNDEPMWEYFPNGAAVQNISSFLDDLKSKPSFIAQKPGGLGFSEIAQAVLRARG